jgi:hypothetical protein
MMCKIEGCDDKSVAHGLCQKHYMRLRRHGDANKVGKPGVKVAEWQQRLLAEHAHDGRSPRTLARLVKAFELLAELDVEQRHAVLALAARPNGSVNVSALLDFASLYSPTENDADIVRLLNHDFGPARK